MIGRLRAWFGRLFGRGGAGSADGDGAGDAGVGADDAAGAATGYECAVCGTAVDGPRASCSLCGAGDVVPVDGDSGAAEAGATSDAAPAEVREADATDDAAAQLRALRDGRADDE